MRYRELILATSSEGKIYELRALMKGINLIPPPKVLKIEEGPHSYLENAYLKARAYFEEFKIPALAEDSGLEISALGNMPGVLSSRFCELEFGGKEPDTGVSANIRKVLRLMEGKEDRRALFRCILLIYDAGAGLWAEGICKGEITQIPRGARGFGYDPIFKPYGEERTMAELSPEEKNAISHRAMAVRELLRLISG
ncbi:MAG: RdgB/HAM1 family non-canonical purine NTP pyrophosphatase [Aquificaceae bacterium]